MARSVTLPAAIRRPSTNVSISGRSELGQLRLDQASYQVVR
jgi:hypothetical protein